MKLSILKLTFLIFFTGVVVNSEPVYPRYIKSYILKDSVFQNVDVIHDDYQVAFSAWKPGTPVPSGTYALYLYNDEELVDHTQSNYLKLGTLKYTSGDSGWFIIPKLTWKNFHMESVLKFALHIEAVDIPEFKNEAMETVYNRLILPHAKNWTYKIYVKNKHESGEGIREENVEINYDFCFKTVRSEGNFKTLGALCTVYLDTNRNKNECYNHERIDKIGADCSNLLYKHYKEQNIG